MMAKGVLHEKKPGADFVRKLREELNGRIVELPDGGVQVFYDFVGEQELADWRTYEPYDAAPTIRDGGLAFGRLEPEETEKQWDRDVRLNLVLDPEAPLEIRFDVTMGTNEPWSCAAWALAGRDGYGPGDPLLLRRDHRLE